MLPRLERRYDPIFTMAVLMHIHPESMVVFDEIARLSDSVLCIEPKPGRHFVSERSYPHDLSRVFSKRGMVLLANENLSNEHWQPNDLPDYAAWRFARRSVRNSHAPA